MNSSYVFDWQKRGGIYPAAKYPYLDRNGRCSYNRRDAVAFVDKAFGYDFEPIKGSHEYIKYVELLKCLLF